VTFLFLLLLAFESFPALHRAIHADANEARHHCAITALTHGQVGAPTVEVSAAAPNERVQSSSPVTIPIFSTTLELLPPGRAPPSVS
jgi:hypothetical protein